MSIKSFCSGKLFYKLLHLVQIVVFGGHIDSWDVGVGAMDDGGGCMISAMVSILYIQCTLAATLLCMYLADVIKYSLKPKYMYSVFIL